MTLFINLQIAMSQTAPILNNELYELKAGITQVSWTPSDPGSHVVQSFQRLLNTNKSHQEEAGILLLKLEKCLQTLPAFESFARYTSAFDDQLAFIKDTPLSSRFLSHRSKKA